MSQTPLSWQIQRLASRQLGPAAGPWDELLRRLWGGHPMLASHFVNALLRHFGTGDEHLCIGRDDNGADVAMLVLIRRSPGLWQSFLPSQAQIGPMLLARPTGLQALLRALPGFAMQVDLLCNDSRFGDLARYEPNPNSTWHALTTSIQLDGGFDAYWAARPNKLRQNMRRYERKLAAHGVPRLVSISDPEHVSAAVHRYASIEAAGWKGQAGTALSPGSGQLAFYADMLHDFATRGAAEIYELWVDSTLMASRLALVERGMLVMLKTTYAEQHAALSPGHILLQWTVQRAFEQHSGKSVEFYTNATQEQQTWSTSTRAIRHVCFFRLRRWGEMVGAIRTARAMTRRHRRGPAIPGSAALEVDRVNSVEDLPVDALRLLGDAEHKFGPEVSMDWYRNLCETVPPLGQHASFELLRRDGQTIAVLPILREPKPRLGSLSIESLANYYTAIYAPAFDPSIHADEVIMLLRGILSGPGKVAQLCLGPMDPFSREYSLLRTALPACGLLALPYFRFGNWYLPWHGSFEGYLASRPGELRSTLRRMSKRFAAVRGRVEIVTGGARVEAAADAYQQVYAASWKQPEPFPAFMPGLIRTSAQRQWLRLGIAWVDEHPVAAQLWIVANGRAEIYKLAYDEQFKAHSPGTLLTAEVMRYVVEHDGVHEIDYLIGDDNYKHAWMTHRRERWGLMAYNPLALAGLAGIVRHAAGSLWSNFRRPRDMPVATSRT